MSAVPAPCHRVAVVPGVSGIDTATVTTGLALAMASVSQRDVLLLDASGTAEPPQRGIDLITRLGLIRAAPGTILPVAPRLSYHAGARPTDLARDWSSHCGLLVVHCGPCPELDLLNAVLGSVHCVVLLTPDTGSGVASVLGALGWLRDQGRAVLADSAIVALTSAAAEDVTADGLATTLEQHCGMVRRVPAELCTLPGGALDPTELTVATQLTLLNLAEAVTAPRPAGGAVQGHAASYSPPRA